MSGYGVITAALVVMGCCLSAWGEVPDPNPRPNPDGTHTWYVGNDTQYPVIQDVLNACSDGDEIVVVAGLYVESLEVIRNDITLRPFCEPPPPAGPYRWSEVVIWNPTEGFNNANGFAIQITGGNNTYVGEPRQITELANGLMEQTMVQPGEWNPPFGVPPDTPFNVTRATLGLGRNAMTFWSRSIDNVAVYSTDGQATFQACDFTSQNGYGGGAIVIGAANTTQFVRCNFRDTFATGQPLRLANGDLGPPVNVITIDGGSPKFLTCVVRDNFSGGPDGVVLDVASRVHWDDCDFILNNAITSRGTYVCLGGTPTFTRTRFQDCLSWMGTVFWDSTGLVGPDMMSFIQCNFVRCTTSDSMRGAVAWVECDDCAGSAPLILLSRCGFEGNQGQAWPPPGGGLTWTQFDVWTPYVPMLRIGANLSITRRITGVDVDGDLMFGDLNGDGLVDNMDLEEMFTVLGTCAHDGDFNGVVDIEDLLGVIAGYGASCQ